MVFTGPTRHNNRVTDDSLIDGYVERLGMGRESPSVEALHRTHRAQVERVPYETIWIHMDQHWTVDREASVAADCSAESVWVLPSPEWCALTRARGARIRNIAPHRRC